MMEKSQTAIFFWAKNAVVWLLILICYFCGLRTYLEMGETNVVSVAFSASYPTGETAKEILQSEREEEAPLDVCFYWNGGLTGVKQEQYGRQADVLAAGIYGNAALYDWRAGGYLNDDPSGCIIDENTALALFGSREAVGGELVMNARTYEVRKIIPWKQNVILFQPQDKETVYTGVFVRRGETDPSEQFLMRHGLAGTAAKDDILKGMALLGVLVLPVILGAAFLCSTWRERKSCRRGSGEYWLWTAACAVTAGGFLIFIWNNFQLPREWIPGQWSDFQFWTDKIEEERESFMSYLMMPKTAVQAQRILSGAKTAGWTLLSILLYLLRKKLLFIRGRQHTR